MGDDEERGSSKVERSGQGGIKRGPRAKEKIEIMPSQLRDTKPYALAIDYGTLLIIFGLMSNFLCIFTKLFFIMTIHQTRIYKHEKGGVECNIYMKLVFLWHIMDQLYCTWYFGWLRRSRSGTASNEMEGGNVRRKGMLFETTYVRT